MIQRPKFMLLSFCHENVVKTLVTLARGSPQGLIWHRARSVAWVELSSSMAISLQTELALFQRPLLPIFLQRLLQKARHYLAIMSCPCACKHSTTIKWIYAFHSLRLKSVFLISFMLIFVSSGLFTIQTLSCTGKQITELLLPFSSSLWVYKALHQILSVLNHSFER